MKIAHIADLHIGRKFEDLSLIEDQKYILKQIIDIVREEETDVLLIAGDIYDKISPNTESFDLFDSLLDDLAHLKCTVIMNSGNHDSSERLGLGGRLFTYHKIHIITDLLDSLTPITLEDEFGPINFYTVPFIKPSDVRNAFEDFKGTSYQEAFHYVIQKMDINLNERNILTAHQFFINAGEVPELSDSETVSVGGVDAIDASIVEMFEYVALGHIHGPQKVKTDTIRYSGSPLKYSFSEINHKKSIPFITLNQKGTTALDFKYLNSKRDVIEIEGRLEDLLKYEKTDDITKATVTNEEELYDAMGKLRTIFPSIVSLEIVNSRTQHSEYLIRANEIIGKSHIERFNDLFLMQNNRELTDKERDILNELILEVSNNETH